MDYIGEPIWVRPWWTPAKSDGGEFPKWFTHWNGEDRPTTDRRSSVVVYLQGDDDHEGLVGYHTNADGSLKKGTAYKIKVKVTAKGNKSYKKGAKIVTLTVKVN